MAKKQVEAAEVAPTVEEAKQMFAENPGLASVVTDQGRLSRDGMLEPLTADE